MYERRSHSTNGRGIIWGLIVMTSIRAFHKILLHQENKKNEAHLAYKESVQSFEVVAEKLYQLLKKKEIVEKSYNDYLETNGTVTNLATHYAYIEQIKREIMTVQTEVNQKRSVMEHKQAKLTEEHVEVKKFESIIDKKQEQIKEKQKYIENQVMDEASNRQYFNHGNR